jgi:hypothetical protein
VGRALEVVVAISVNEDQQPFLTFLRFRFGKPWPLFGKTNHRLLFGATPLLFWRNRKVKKRWL